MKAVVSVIGKDKTGIIAAAATELARLGINILDISQTIMQTNFVMVMLVDAGKSPAFDKIEAALIAALKEFEVVVHVQQEDLFNSMQRV